LACSQKKKKSSKLRSAVKVEMTASWIGRQGGDDFASWIGRQGGDDFASWPYSHFGQYTVKSAYYIARADGFVVDRSRKGQGSSSVNQHDCKRWKTLWSTKAPGKMKITLWRFAHDCGIHATSK
jgi:hypothetical protein